MSDAFMDWYKWMTFFTGGMGVGMLIKAGLVTESSLMIVLCILFTALFFVRRKRLKEAVK